jgi:DUF971 family protein
MNHSNQDAIRPASIEVDPDEGLMRIVWQDGHESIYELAALRPQCPCAHCRGEMGMPGAIDEQTVFSKEQTTLADMREVGRYAVQPVWADGHETGYFTFVQLRSLCPCEQCQSLRGTARGLIY